MVPATMHRSCPETGRPQPKGPEWPARLTKGEANTYRKLYLLVLRLGLAHQLNSILESALVVAMVSHLSEVHKRRHFFSPFHYGACCSGPAVYWKKASLDSISDFLSAGCCSTQHVLAGQLDSYLHSPRGWLQNHTSDMWPSFLSIYDDKELVTFRCNPTSLLDSWDCQKACSPSL